MLLHVLFISLPVFIVCQQNFANFRKQHSYQQLTDGQVTHLSALTNTTHLNEVLDNICVPRIVGTKEHTAVHNYIVGELEQLGWNVDIDSFEERTPIFGVLTFRNIIATLNTQADRYLVLACHYDSKFFPNFEFQGATDSAVPCAMMLNLAKVMKNELNNDDNLHLKLIFFDGEEAFKQWSKKDSIYGARHLAAAYADKVATTRSGYSVNELSRMDLFILLDLIGGPNPSFLNNFSRTTRWHMRLVEIEERLSDSGLLVKSGSYFKTVDNNLNIIEDDHVPFLARGVPVLHLIPMPFPNIWHTIGDNREFVDVPTVEHINQILRVFVAEYLHLDVEEYPDDDDDDTFREEL